MIDLQKESKMTEETVGIREELAAYAHAAWSGWMHYMFGKGTHNDDGTWTLPDWAVERWKRQASTEYADLPESEKESDRKEADRMMNLVRGTKED